MASKTGIAWTESTWNPTVGCTVLSPGCTHCYAMREAARIAAFGGPVAPKYRGLTRKTKGGPVWTGELRLWEPALDQPLRWARPRMIFVNSMSDLAHEDMPAEWFGRIYRAMVEAQQARGHIFQVLTKRPENLIALLAAIGVTRPPAGIWFGVSAEDERRWDERVPLLGDIPTAVPWVSVEPQLELIDRNPKGLGWVVIGGESGKPKSKARAFDAEWARLMIKRCRRARVPVFMKQLGSFAHDGDRRLEPRHYAGADPEEWPAELRVREYPVPVAAMASPSAAGSPSSTRPM
jgi:protein gp37